MGAIKDVMAVMREVLLLTDKIDRSGQTLSEISNELRNHDHRLIRLETMVEVSKYQVSQKQVIGADKTGKDRWYEKYVPIADRIYDEHLDTLRKENLKDGS